MPYKRKLNFLAAILMLLSSLVIYYVLHRVEQGGRQGSEKASEVMVDEIILVPND